MNARLLLLIALAAGSVAAQDAAKPEIDNAWVRVTRVKQAAHGKALLRSQSDSVVVFVTDGIARKAGDAVYFPAGKAAEADAADQPLEAVRIELKPGAPRSSAVALDPVKLDPEHHIVLLENERVRVIRTILEPHLKAPMHEHPHYVVVYITELHTTMLMADGRAVDNLRHPGEIAWRNALKHATENVGERTASEVQVELK